jgi:hypothetical protein
MAGKKGEAVSSGRAKKPTSGRTGPIRDGWTPPGLAGAKGHEDVGDVVADAVRAGYRVIGENLRQGRAAADRLAAGRYEMTDAPDDLSALGNRLVQLGRELSTVWFDLVGAVLRDPALKDALKPHHVRAAAPPSATPEAPGRMLSALFLGTDRARAKAVPMLVAERPFSLVTAGFHPLGTGQPPITKVTFTVSGDGEGIVALIEVPEHQPAGRYTGTVCDASTGEPVAALTIEVA